MTVFFCVCDCILLDVGLCHYYIMDNKIPQCQYPGNTLKYQAGKKKKFCTKDSLTRNIMAPSAVRKQSLKVNRVHFP